MDNENSRVKKDDMLEAIVGNNGCNKVLPEDTDDWKGYTCQQCNGYCEVFGNLVICEDCSYEIPKDTADKLLLLAVCEDAILYIPLSNLLMDKALIAIKLSKE